jgi:peptidoglycan/xylan/chitin deacetylase (PgdA/CDA1 family)
MKLAVRERLSRAVDTLGLAEAVLKARWQVGLPVLTVLTYHRVARVEPGHLFDDGVIDATPEQLDQHLEILGKHFSVMGVAELREGLAGGRLPPNPALITFDDGYRSCHDVVAPVLQRHGMSAVFFIATHYVSARRPFWWSALNYLAKVSQRDLLRIEYPFPMTLELGPHRDAAIRMLIEVVKVTRGLDVDRFTSAVAGASGVNWSASVQRRLADELVMTWDDVRRLQASGMDIQSHTRRHYVLQTLSPASLAEELVGARCELERRTGTRPSAVSYPIGHGVAEDPAIRAAVADAGYELGFSNATGVNYLWHGIDPLDIRRISLERCISRAELRGALAFPSLGHVGAANGRQYPWSRKKSIDVAMNPRSSTTTSAKSRIPKSTVQPGRWRRTVTDSAPHKPR